ncbi:MAG TPA: SDR family oxidoreductase, partial [Chroococcales cyanobacterium]
MSKGKLILFTGFPGILGSHLAKRLLASAPDSRILALVRERSQEHGRREIERIEAAYPAFQGRLSLIHGDLISPDLGLWRHLEELRPKIDQIFHLATTFKIKADPSFTHRINVVGTRNVVDLARRCPNLTRLQYLSTVHVSGQYKGRFSEEDFDLKQTFKNAYEESKFQAEREVRESGLPATIYRPGIMAGDSLSG